MNEAETAWRLKLAGRAISEWRTPPASPGYQRVLAGLFAIHPYAKEFPVRAIDTVTQYDETGALVYYLSNSLPSAEHRADTDDEDHIPPISRALFSHARYRAEARLGKRPLWYKVLLLMVSADRVPGPAYEEAVRTFVTLAVPLENRMPLVREFRRHFWTRLAIVQFLLSELFGIHLLLRSRLFDGLGAIVAVLRRLVGFDRAVRSSLWRETIRPNLWPIGAVAVVALCSVSALIDSWWGQSRVRGQMARWVDWAGWFGSGRVLLWCGSMCLIIVTVGFCMGTALAYRNRRRRSRDGWHGQEVSLMLRNYVRNWCAADVDVFCSVIEGDSGGLWAPAVLTKYEVTPTLVTTALRLLRTGKVRKQMKRRLFAWLCRVRIVDGDGQTWSRGSVMSFV